MPMFYMGGGQLRLANKLVCLLQNLLQIFPLQSLIFRLSWQILERKRRELAGWGGGGGGGGIEQRKQEQSTDH